MAAYKTEDILLELERKFSGSKLPENRRMGSGRYTNELYPYSALFSPVTLGGLKLKNRVMAAVFDKALQKEYVSGGTGLICVPIEHDRSFDELRRVRNLISDAHRAGAYVFAEFSVIDDGSLPAFVFRNETRKAAKAFADEVIFHGFDGVFIREINAGALTALRQIRGMVGSEMPIICDVKLSNALNECYGGKMDDVKELKPFKAQKSIAETLDCMCELVQAGADMFCVGMGSLHNAWLFNPVKELPAGCFLDLSKYVKEYFAAIGLKSNRGYEIPVIASGRLSYPDIAEKALRDGMCDIVMLDETDELDPAWCKKAMSGKIDSILPLAPFSAELREKPVLSECPQKIAVIGAGEIGLRFALSAAKRGHDVTVYETDTMPGGMLRTKASPAYAYECGNYLDRLIKLCEEHENLTLRLGCHVEEELLSAGNYDALIFADGKKQSAPSVPGWGEIPSISAKDIMLHPENCPDVKGKKVVVLGGNRLGCECALRLKDKGCKKLTLLESGEYLYDENSASAAFIIHCLDIAGVRIHNCASPVYIKDGGIYYREADEDSKRDPYCTWMCTEETEKDAAEDFFTGFAACELIVLADGWNDNILGSLEAAEIGSAPFIRRVDTLESALRLAAEI